jgi:DNA modification methylase
MKTTMKINNVKVDTLNSDPANVRKHDAKNLEAIKGSLKRFGQQKPIVIDGDGVVRAGNGTLEAARALGWTHIDTVTTPLQGSDATAYAIADNRTAELADWDDSALAETLAALQNEDGFDHLAAGFTDAEIESLIGDAVGLTDIVEDDVPEPPADPVTKTGDLITLGGHRLLCGDSTKAEDVARLMDGDKAAHGFTSPPYNAGNSKTGAYNAGSAKRKDFKQMYEHDKDDMSAEEYRGFLLLVLNRCAEVLEDDGVMGWNVGYNAKSREDYGVVLFGDANPLRVKESIVWDKSVGMNVCANNVYSRSAEFVFMLSATDKYKSNQDGGVYWNIWRINTRDGDNMQNGHGASFPVALPAQSIQQHSGLGDIVLEPFMGSGTTLIAAEQLGRKCYGIEISPAYCDVIVTRWETLTGKQATRESNG